MDVGGRTGTSNTSETRLTLISLVGKRRSVLGLRSFAVSYKSVRRIYEKEREREREREREHGACGDGEEDIDRGGGGGG